MVGKNQREVFCDVRLYEIQIWEPNYTRQMILFGLRQQNTVVTEMAWPVPPQVFII